MLFVVRFLRYRSRILPWRDVVNRPALTGNPGVEPSYGVELRHDARLARMLD